MKNCDKVDCYVYLRWSENSRSHKYLFQIDKKKIPFTSSMIKSRPGRKILFSNKSKPIFVIFLRHKGVKSNPLCNWNFSLNSIPSKFVRQFDVTLEKFFTILHVDHYAIQWHDVFHESSSTPEMTLNWSSTSLRKGCQKLMMLWWRYMTNWL